MKLTEDMIRTIERDVNYYKEGLNATSFNVHNTSDDRIKTREDAIKGYFRALYADGFLWAKQNQKRIIEGDREAIDNAILYLEVDPFYFRSGYLKELLLHRLKQAPLTEDDKERLRNVILKLQKGLTVESSDTTVILLWLLLQMNLRRLLKMKLGLMMHKARVSYHIY